MLECVACVYVWIRENTLYMLKQQKAVGTCTTAIRTIVDRLVCDVSFYFISLLWPVMLFRRYIKLPSYLIFSQPFFKLLVDSPKGPTACKCLVPEIHRSPLETKPKLV